MKLCILELDRPIDEQALTYGSYADMFENWLSPALPEAAFSRVALDRGEQLPELHDFDGYLLTGCRYGVYDDIPWKEALQQFLLLIRDVNKPLGGVCFGHQIMADTFGAEVRKADNGWVVGKETYSNKSAFAIHQDQVLTAPEGARSVSGSHRCPIGRIDYAFPALSIQYHPEFSSLFIPKFLQSWRDNPIPASCVDNAESDFAAELNREALAMDFADVFRHRPGDMMSAGTPLRQAADQLQACHHINLLSFVVSRRCSRVI